MMEFERAIEDAQTLFIFDRRSQQKLQEMAAEARPRSKDRYLILLTQAAFAYYNSTEGQNTELRRIIRQGMSILNEVKRFREDRVYFTFALKLEVDLLMHLSTLNYQDAPRAKKPEFIFNEEDTRALAICESLLKYFPPSFDPLPSNWYSGVVPLFPNYREEMVQFYKNRDQDNRAAQLSLVLPKIRHEMVVAAGILKTKQFFAERGIMVTAQDRVARFLHSHVLVVGRFIEAALPLGIHLATDITVPRGISASQLETATRNVEAQIDQAHRGKDIRKYTGHLLQMGILQFLQGDPEEAVSALVRTLKASARVDPQDRKARQYKHEKFPDIPFMVGTSYLRGMIPDPQQIRLDPVLLKNCITSLMRAILLQNRYHQAYVNLITALRIQGDLEEQDALFGLYLKNFDNDISQLSSLAFSNLAFMEYQKNAEELNSEIVKWMLLAQFSTGGEFTKAKKMLQELKTLYILNAHQFSASYLETYRTGFRMKDEEFIQDLEDNELHSAILFYISHAYSSLSLTSGREGNEIVIDYGNLEQSIDLNTEALYFNPRNGSAVRLVTTQVQVLQYALRRTLQNWENINKAMGQRFQFYEEYLRQDKCITQLTEHLKNLKLGRLVPKMKLPRSILIKMDEVISNEQRDRIKHRVEAT